MAMVWPASREFGFIPNNIPKFVPAAQSNVIPFINSVAWVKWLQKWLDMKNLII